MTYDLSKVEIAQLIARSIEHGLCPPLMTCDGFRVVAEDCRSCWLRWFGMRCSEETNSSSQEDDRG